MSKPPRNSRAWSNALAALVFIALPLAPWVLAEDAEKPLGVAIEEKRAEVKRLDAEAQALRESFRRWKRSLREDQDIIIRQAEARYQNAKLTRQVAEIAVIEYEKGTYVIERQKAEGEIQLAKHMLDLARKDNPRQDPRIHQLELERAKYKLESAETSLEILEKYTKPRRSRYLQSEVEKEKSNELAEEATLSLELTKEKKLQQMEQELHVAGPEERVLALLDQSVALEEKLKGVLEEVKALEAKVKQEPKDVEELTTKLRQKKAEAANVSGKALRQLDEAIYWANEVTTRRKALMQAEEKLKSAQAELDALQDKASGK